MSGTGLEDRGNAQQALPADAGQRRACPQKRQEALKARPSPFPMAAAHPDAFTLIDLRPLRPLMEGSVLGELAVRQLALSAAWVGAKALVQALEEQVLVRAQALEGWGPAMSKGLVRAERAAPEARVAARPRAA
jgi:hypothetical protein